MKKLTKRRRNKTKVIKNGIAVPLKKRKKKEPKQTWEKRYCRVRSRHPSHSEIRKRNNGILCNHVALLRLGSCFEPMSNFFKRTNAIELNTPEAIKNSSNKLTMKACFKEAGVQSPDFWATPDEVKNAIDQEATKFPILAKLVYGSRGNGMKKLDNMDQLDEFIQSQRFLRHPRAYYFERYHSFNKEYRIHVTKFGCFYTNRKMLREDVPEDQRWFRNSTNSVWYLETNPLFDKPDTWDAIVADCVRGLEAVGLDIGAFDVRVSNKGTHKIVEVNSAASFGAGTEEEYRKIIPILVDEKAKELGL